MKDFIFEYIIVFIMLICAVMLGYSLGTIHERQEAVNYNVAVWTVDREANVGFKYLNFYER